MNRYCVVLCCDATDIGGGLFTVLFIILLYLFISYIFNKFDV